MAKPKKTVTGRVLHDPVKDKLKRFELLQILGTDIFYPTIGSAIDNYVERYNIDWRG